MPPTILVAPAAFKGTFGPRQVAEAMVSGVRRAMPQAAVLAVPVADGGDGLLDALLAPSALRERVSATGPLGTPVQAELGWIDPETAILESATACGLALLQPEQRAPLVTTTHGVGELIVEAADRGARTVIVGLGGSATVDGGTGAARGMGWVFHDAAGSPLPEGGGALADLADWTSGWKVNARVIALADVQTPLVGPDGAARVFGPQKGATPADVERLAAGLERLAEVMALHGQDSLATRPGGGAAGGLGAGLISFARAELEPGAPWVLDQIGFDAALAKADLVLIGEGAFDGPSLLGKAPGEVLRRAQAARKRVVLVTGSASDVPNIAVVTGDGAWLDAAGIATLAERAVREVFAVPV